MKKIISIILMLSMFLAFSGCSIGGGDSDSTYKANDKADFSALDMPTDGGLSFGTNDVKVEARFGSHDPTCFKDPESGIYYSYSTDNGFTGTRRSLGVQIKKSEDLINWEMVGLALDDASIAEARDNGKDAQKTGSFWAPDIVYVNGEYRLYYASTKAFGTAQSQIWLAVSDNPEGPFTNRGVVVSSWQNVTSTGPNAIDPDIITTKDGKSYIVYGSFFGGIYIKELDEQGLAVDNDTSSLYYYGTKLAQRCNNTLDGPEGSSIIYNEDEGYYYLFVSYGWLGNTYDIRVGRSKEVTGPYLDFNGNDLAKKADTGDTGTKLAASYYFTASNPGGDQEYTTSTWEWGGFRAPGHGVPFLDDDGSYYFVHHIRDGATSYYDPGNDQYYMHYLMVRKMVFVNGWPVLSPESYAGESDEKIAESYIAGNWETISFTSAENEQAVAVSSVFKKNGKVTYGDQKGKWTYDEDENLLTITLSDDTVITAKVLKCWDLENDKASICFTGLDNNGIAHWGKFC